MRWIILLLLLVSCNEFEPEKIIIDPGVLQVTNNMFSGEFSIKYADRLVYKDWFDSGYIKTYDLKALEYRIYLDREGIGHLSKEVRINANDTTKVILIW